MPDNQRGFPEVNRVIHEPARLAILTVLSACASADFTFLQSATGLSKGNLSVQITRLEEAGLISVDKSSRGRRHALLCSYPTGGAFDWGSIGVRCGGFRSRCLESFPSVNPKIVPEGNCQLTCWLQ
jgi:DNA-binding transcriptional ArsR family regulator